MAEKRILIVDNEPSILIAFKKIMQRPGTVIHTTETVLEAMNMLTQTRYHLVLADLRLTGIDKAEGLSILRFARQRDPDVVTALMTAYGNSEIRERSDDYKVNYYMEKPVKPDTLRELAAIIQDSSAAVAGITVEL